MEFDDPAMRQLAGFIRDFGWGVRHVGSDPSGSAPFSYTVGLSALNHPEIVATGLPFEAAQTFLNLIGESVKSGRVYVEGEVTTELTDDGRVAFIRAVNVAGLTAVDQMYGSVDALQLVWTDSAGAFPWQSQFRNPPETQPLLGVVPDSIRGGEPDDFLA
jgi:hypothetical protein